MTNNPEEIVKILNEQFNSVLIDDLVHATIINSFAFANDVPVTLVFRNSIVSPSLPKSWLTDKMSQLYKNL